MALSIPRRYGSLPGPPGERRVRCDYCSLLWYRSQLRRDPAGFLACPDGCQDGRDTVTCDRQNAANAAQTRGRRPPPERW